jgi:hypothetical protein
MKRSNGLMLCGLVAIAAVWGWVFFDPPPKRAEVHASSAPVRGATKTRQQAAKRPGADQLTPEQQEILALADRDANDWQRVADDGADASQATGKMGGDAKPKVVAAVEFDAKTLKVLRSLAREAATCKQGSASSCADLDAGGGSGRRQLAKALGRLTEGCAAYQLPACKLGGELKLASLDLDGAAALYHRAKELAKHVKSRCADKVETRAAICKEAGDSLHLIAAKEAEIDQLRLAH